MFHRNKVYDRQAGVLSKRLGTDEKTCPKRLPNHCFHLRPSWLVPWRLIDKCCKCARVEWVMSMQ